MKDRLILLLLALSVALAGCANNGSDPGDGDGAGDGDGGGNVSPPPQTTPEDARTQLEQASASVPEKLTLRATVTKGSRLLMGINGTFDNTTGTSYMQLRGDPEALGGMGDGGAMGFDAMGDAFRDGFSLYSGPEGSLYLVNGTALTFPPGNHSGQSSFGVPSPDASPFGQFLQPGDLLGGLAATNTTVKSVNSTVYRGKPALEVAVTTTEGGQPADATVTLFTNPPRIARIDGLAPSDPDSPADPFAGARFVADFYYDNEVRLDVPEAARRAVGLSYISDQPPFGGDSRAPATWTFQSDVGVPVAEVEARVKDVSAADPSDVTGIPGLPTLWSMPLSNGTQTQGELTLTFTDANGDGKVNKGDTLRVEGANPGVRVVLYDTETGTHVVPGAGLVLALAGLGVAAFILRRR